ncbi:MAG: PAS domain S-box protein [Halieaceae bacterium]|jgi:PAS domain S-box-containing protein|nr:PAS domain S-box protein [Halieaceae bacterium]
MAVFSDVTEKLALESDLRKQTERFRMLLEFIRDYVIYTLNEEGIVDSWNKSGERGAGVPNEMALGRPFQEVLHVFGGDGYDAGELLQRVRDEGSCDIECRVTGSRGEDVWFEKSITKLQGRHGEPEGFSVIAHNMTEHKKLELRLKHLSETDPLTGAANRRDSKPAFTTPSNTPMRAICCSPSPSWISTTSSV